MKQNVTSIYKQILVEYLNKKQWNSAGMNRNSGPSEIIMNNF